MKSTNKTMILVLLIATLVIPYTGYIKTSNAEEQPRYGGTLKIRHRGNPISFNGFLNYWSVSRDLHQQVYNRLLTLDENRNLAPDLAESWEFLDGGKKFVFHLYDNVTWHDGVPFTSEDVKWHWERLLEPDIDPYVRPLLEPLEYIEAPDPYTVIFVFSKPIQPILFAYFQSDTYIHPKHIFDGTDLETNPANFAPIGTGPFKVVDFVPESYCIMEANEDYFRGRPYLDGLIWKIIPDESSSLIAFEAGEVDITAVPNEEIPRLEKMPGVGIRWTSSTTNHRITFNFREEALEKNPWVGNLKVRQAFAHAINKDLLIERVHKGLARPCDTAIAPAAGMYYNPDVKIYEYDPELAETLLDEAGYPRGSDGVRIKTEFMTYDRWYGVQGSEIMIEMLKEVGIEAILKPVEYVTYVALYEHSEEGLGDQPFTYNHMGSWPPEEIGSWMHSKPEGGMNMGFYSNSEVDTLLEEGYALTDPAARKEKYDRIQEIIAEELPYLFLLTQESSTVYNNEFTNFESLLPSGSWKAYDKVWWKKGELPVAPTPPTPPIGEEIEPRIESLEESVENLSTKISSLETQLSSLESKMGSLEDKIGTIPTGANVAYGAVGISVIAIVIAIAIYFITQK